MLAGVIINKKTAALNSIFYYLVPAGLDVKPGQLVEVEFGKNCLEAVVVELTATADVPSEKLKEIKRLIDPKPLFGADLLALSQFAADYYLTSRASMLQAMLPSGMMLTGKMPRAKTCRRVKLLQPGYAARGAKQRQVLQILQATPQMPADELMQQAEAAPATLKTLAEKGVIAIVEEESWEGEDMRPLPQRPQLSTDQQRVLQRIHQNMAGDNKPVLLHGVTGSGKTEVYLHLAEKVRAGGKQVIILVPEIALTPQTVRVFQRRFGGGVAVLHSGLTGAERRQAWLGIAGGHYDLVIGARSAIFAPTPNLGLIIIDEEHESSYKQENAPRFHTRTLAAERCRLTGAGLVFGSATPDVESYYKADRGEYLLLEMPHRIGGQSPAAVTVVDMSSEFKSANNSVFSRLLQQKLKQNWQQGRQSMLFLNRRGYESFVSCRACGYVVECPHCSVAMAYHLGDEILKCHYCGQTRRLPTTCPKCGSTAIRFFGAGTQKIAEAVQRLLPEARIARLDRDVAAKRGSVEQIYKAMLAGDIDILVGTQMIAKGLDFPNLTLVGVVAADQALNMPDYKSGERAFQLTVQVAGRAGRHQKGEVVIQTYQPTNDILRAAALGDYRAFYQKELLRRSLAGYPPFSSMIRVIISAITPDMALMTGRRLADNMRRAVEAMSAADEVKWFGPRPCPKAKIKDRYRLQIYLKGKNLALLREVCRRAVSDVRLPKDANLVIDVEPLSMM